MLMYKGYKGKAIYDDEIGMFAGTIINVASLGTFYAKNVDDLEKEFKKTIDTYLQVCKDKGIKPIKPYSGKFVLRLSPALHSVLAEKAEEEGESLNNFIQHIITDSLNCNKT